jgi:protocatechuate 3,4-dioxygenase beta subunit
MNRLRAGSTAWIAASLLLSAGALAQQEDARYSLNGTVINQKTGEPVKRAMVRLSCHGNPGIATSQRRPNAVLSAMADDSGRFVFRALPRGSCSVNAEKPGFRLAPGGEQIEFPGAVENLAVPLSPLASVTGKVTDQDGLPVRGVTVFALASEVQDGFRQSRMSRTITTDDRGVYRMWNFAPGKYYIKAAGRSGGTNLYAGDTTPLYMSEEAFAPIFAGGGRALESAMPVSLNEGEEAHADLAIQWEPAFKIRGSLQNFVPRRQVKFELITGQDAVPASRVAVNGDTGTFEIQDVVPGAYLLRATQNDATAELAISVGAADLTGIGLALAAPVDIPVVTHLSDPSPAPQDAHPLPRRFRGSLCRAELRAPVRPEFFGSLPPGDGEEMRIAGVRPGNYRVNVQCAGAYVRSAMAGTQDLLSNPILTIVPGAAPTPIEILASAGGGTVNGIVERKEQVHDESIHVLLVPQFAPTTGPMLADTLFDQSESGAKPEFFFSNVTPGNYVAYAFSGDAEIEFRNPEFLKGLSGGVAVQVTDQAEVKITIPGVLR